MPEEKSGGALRQLCLRCGRRPASVGWQCRSCVEQFRDWGDRDYAAVIDQLERHGRTLASIADRLDGAGLWAAAKSLWRAEEKLADLAAAIAQESPKP